MSTPRSLLVILILWVAVVPVGAIAGWLAPARVTRTLGASFELLMLSAFVAAVALMAWMLFRCIRSTRLSRAEKNRWYGLLVVGGPITASAYLWSELPSTSARA